MRLFGTEAEFAQTRLDVQPSVATNFWELFRNSNCTTTFRSSASRPTSCVRWLWHPTYTSRGRMQEVCVVGWVSDLSTQSGGLCSASSAAAPDGSETRPTAASTQRLNDWEGALRESSVVQRTKQRRRHSLSAGPDVRPMRKNATLGHETQSATTPARAFLRSRLRSLRDARFQTGVCRSSSSVLRIGGEPSTAGRGVVGSNAGDACDSRSRCDSDSDQVAGSRCGFC